MTPIGLRYLSVIERLKSDKTVIAAGLGDSLTFGWMVGRGFYDRFIDGLNPEYPGADIRSINAGMPGDTAKGGVSRAPRLLEEKPHLLVIQFGINDCFKGISLDEYKNALIKMSSDAVEVGCAPLLVTSCPMRDKNDQVILQRFYHALCATARDHHIDHFDICEYWLANSNTLTLAHDLFLTDGVHPSDAGHQLMADALLSFFLKQQ